MPPRYGGPAPLLALAALLSLSTPSPCQQTTPACEQWSSIRPVAFFGAELERVLTDVPYGPHPCQRLYAFLVAASAPAPLIIDVHGGSWSGGRKSTFFDVHNPDKTHDALLRKALEAGISVVSINYRLTARTDDCCDLVLDAVGQPMPELAHAWPVPNRDAALALQHARAMGRAGRWNVDPDRVALVGVSAGGTLALSIGLSADQADPQSPDPVARELTRPQCIASIATPTRFLADSIWLCSSGPVVPGIWYFGTTDATTFNTDPTLDPIKTSASPEWIAMQAGGPSAGFDANRILPVLGLYEGDPGWTLGSFFVPADPCQEPTDPLWKPNPDPHSPLFGFLMDDALRRIGSTVSELSLEPPDACPSWVELESDGAVDFLAHHLAHGPGEDLSHLYPGKPGTGGLPPHLGAFGLLEQDGAAVLWLRDAPAGAPATLAWSATPNPSPWKGGTLWPDPATAQFLAAGVTDDCGHLSFELPGSLATGDVYAQIVLADPGNTHDTGLSNPVKLTFLP